MATTLEDRLALLEARVDGIEESVERSRRPRFAVTVEEAWARLRSPAERKPEDVERLRAIYGCFDGPEDLSEHVREYASGRRE
jgi:hypothetical protein